MTVPTLPGENSLKALNVGACVSITNHHKPSGLQQHKCLVVLEVSSPKWVSLGHSEGVGRPAFLPGGSGGISVLVHFPALEAARIPRLVALLSSSNQQWRAESFSHVILH